MVETRSAGAPPAALARTAYGKERLRQGWKLVEVPLPPYGSLQAVVDPRVLTRYSAPYLAHLALVSAIADARGWEGRWEIPEGKPGEAVPDALWYRNGEVWAVEVDLGYSRQKVARKVEHYRRIYHGQVWGVFSPQRRREILAKAWPGRVEVLLIRPEEVVG